MRDLHQNVFSSQRNGLSSLLNSLPSDSEYTSASESETPEYFLDLDDTLVRALPLATDEPHISLRMSLALLPSSTFIPLTAVIPLISTGVS